MSETKVHVVIVLGNKLRSNHIHQELKGRMDVGIKVFMEKEAHFMVLSGGKSNPYIKYAECEIMRDYAVSKGINPDKIIMDSKSLDTIGNAYFTRRIIEKLGNVKNICVISSCYHMKRVEFIFRMCYGYNFNLIFDFCYDCDSQNKEKEEKKLSRAKDFFAGISPGDIDKIERKIFSSHKLYATR